MKKLLSLLIILFISCKNNDEALSIVKQNNDFMKEEFENYGFLLKEKSIEDGYLVEPYKSFNSLSTEINNLKSKVDYDKIFNQIKKINSESIVPIKIESINSENLEILKNNLFLNVTKLFKVYRLKSWSTYNGDCVGITDAFSLEKNKKNDTISIKFKTYDPIYWIYQDSIVENGKLVKKAIQLNDYKLTTIKYISDADYSVFYGKVIMADAIGKPFIIKNIKETFNKK